MPDMALDRLQGALDVARTACIAAAATMKADGDVLDREVGWGIDQARRVVYQEIQARAAYLRSGEPERLAADE